MKTEVPRYHNSPPIVTIDIEFRGGPIPKKGATCDLNFNGFKGEYRVVGTRYSEIRWDEGKAIAVVEMDLTPTKTKLRKKLQKSGF